MGEPNKEASHLWATLSNASKAPERKSAHSNCLVVGDLGYFSDYELHIKLSEYFTYIGCGKSSLVSDFLNPTKDEKIKPTVALEYTFARRSNSKTGAKDIAHIWELAGNIHNSALVRVPMGRNQISKLCTVIVLDFASPQNIVSSFFRWFTIVQQELRTCVETLDSKVRKQDLYLHLLSNKCAF